MVGPRGSINTQMLSAAPRETTNVRYLFRGFPLPSYGDSSYHQLMPKRKRSHATGMRTKLTEHNPGRTDVPAITTAIHIPRDTWSLLRAVAFRRAQDHGGRASVSRLIAELVERHRAALEQEIK